VNLSTISPSLDEYRQLCADYDVVPVCRKIAADLDTPVSAFLKLHVGGHGFLLESVEGQDKVGRYSFLGTKPAMTLSCEGGSCKLSHRDGREETMEGKPLEVLGRLLGKPRVADSEELKAFSGGFVGYFAYDLVRSVEKLPESTTNDLGVADLSGMIVDAFVVFDNVRHTMTAVKLTFPADRDDGIDQAWADAVAELEDTVRLLSEAVAETPPPGPGGKGSPVSNMTPGQYGESVEAAGEYIRAGDIIQVVLSQRYEQELQVNPFSIYRALRTINPSPYMFFLDLEDEIAVGASPEVLVKVDGDRVHVRPIAGTVRRGETPEEDDRLVAAMLADPKERAEHVMLLDLGRNDVGRVAVTGSVSVDEQMVVEKYSHVNHIVSHVSGRLRDDCDRLDAFAAAHPAGTLSGAPKVRAMEIIEELEPTRRGLYGGGVGWVDYSGNLDTCIAIRTALIKGGRVYMQVGAGIVADSDPSREQAECEAKIRGMILALEKAGEMERG
jgi:anthranilate synthase component 1